LTSKEVDFMIKLRDAFSMLAGTPNEYLNSLVPEEVREESPACLPGTENLTNFPWKSYKTKQPANPDEAAWIFSNIQGAETLLATLKTSDKAVRGDFEYQLRANGKFIARKQLKKKAP
jgi:hypothetical protein